MASFSLVALPTTVYSTKSVGPSTIGTGCGLTEKLWATTPTRRKIHLELP